MSDTMTNEYATLEVRVHRTMQVPPTNRLGDLLKEWGMDSAMQESAWVVTYDSMKNLRRVTEVARGSYHEVDISIPAVMAAVFKSGTDRFMLVHNHPNGNVNPSEVDYDLTAKVMRAANTCGLSFDDHIILGMGGGYYSMAEHGEVIPSTGSTAAAAARRVRANPSRTRYLHHHDEA